MSVGGAKQFFDEVGARYEELFGHNEAHIRFVARSLERIITVAQEAGAPAPHVLDIGQGTGRPTAAMAAAAGCRVQGIDVSPAMTAIARRQVPSGTFETADMLEWAPAPGAHRFDAAFAIHCTGQLAHAGMRAAAARWAAWLGPRGFLFLGTMLAADFGPGAFRPDADAGGDAGMAGKVGRVERMFMGERCTFNVYTEEGLEELLAAAGFEILDVELAPFYAPGCDMEPHSFITCRKV